MLYISLPADAAGARRLPFYLAMEEWVARNVDADDCFFMWQVEPTVIFGRNQLIANEVNQDYCREHGIQMYRRKSGGGCVYADMSNVMFSYVTKADSVVLTYNRYINMVVLALRKLGIDAYSTGRNDVLIAESRAADGTPTGRKVSGTAFYHTMGHSILHSTMLYDTNMENMVGSITPTNEKLLSKGVESVRQRIALLKDYTDIPLADFMSRTRSLLCDGEYTLTPRQVAEVEQIEQEYYDPRFIFGNNPRHTVVRRRRIEGVGDLELRLDVSHGQIKSAELLGDYFLVGDQNGLLRALEGVTLEREALEKALPETADIIMNLRRDDLINLIIQ